VAGAPPRPRFDALVTQLQRDSRRSRRATSGRVRLLLLRSVHALPRSLRGAIAVVVAASSRTRLLSASRGPAPWPRTSSADHPSSLRA
jgi:hypothetical protein